MKLRYSSNFKIISTQSQRIFGEFLEATIYFGHENKYNFSELETAVNSFSAATGPFNLGNTSFLAQETSQERQVLYSQLVNSYKWIDKIHEHSYLAHNVLTSNHLKRSGLSKRGGRVIQQTLNNANSIQ